MNDDNHDRWPKFSFLGCDSVDGDADTGRFWRFSCAFYAADGVAKLCLRLQDECGWDVNLALFALWLSAEARRPTAEQLAEAAALSASWRAEAVAPLRALRVSLKERAATDKRLAAFRASVKALELEAERLQQLRLEALAPPPSETSEADFSTRARALLATLEARRPVGADNADDLLDDLVRTARAWIERA